MTQDDTLWIELPNAFSWTRPKALPGVIHTKKGPRPRVGYSDDKVAERAEWALLVRGEVNRRDWTLSPDERYAVSVTIRSGGRLDPDRVVSAVLDALVSGGAIREDSVVDQGHWERVRLRAGEQTSTLVRVQKLPAAAKRRAA
ncbi:MAG TPA: hypothetical protein VD948_06585 [Rhodothermales bacterium]|nr:hypothetical protein [Rhodothermales bacterium]